MATWSAIDDRIKAILALVTEINRVYATVPRTLNDADFPAAMVIPQPNTRARQGGDNVKDTRTFDIQVYIANVRSGIRGEKEDYAVNLDMWDAIYAQFDSRPRLGLDDTGIVTSALITGDTGLQLLQYPQQTDNLYYGIVFTLNVERVTRHELRR